MAAILGLILVLAGVAGYEEGVGVWAVSNQSNTLCIAAGVVLIAAAALRGVD